MIVMGIDPGVHTGIAVYRDAQLRAVDTFTPYVMPEVFETFHPGLVVFEDSRKQSVLWHAAPTKAAVAKIARNVGEIDAWCKLIEALCAARGTQAIGLSPKEKGAKRDAAAFTRITGWTARTNEHERDAAMLAWFYRTGAHW